MKILLAEDEPITLATILYRLKRDGHEVIAATNGQEAMALYLAHKPDLVITDIKMPFASGLEVLSFVRNQVKVVPVIVLSASGQESVAVEAITLGAEDYMTKPFNPDELALKVKRVRQHVYG